MTSLPVRIEHFERPVHFAERIYGFGKEVSCHHAALAGVEIVIRPLNPVLGELFYGYWPDKAGRGKTNLIVEQVSHHPPITAYYIENKTRGLRLQGHNAQKTSFSGGAIIVKQIGHAILTVDLADGQKEEFLITLPRLRIDGLWYGSPYIELSDTTKIQSSSGWLSTVCLFLVRMFFIFSLLSLSSARSSTKAKDTSPAKFIPSKPMLPHHRPLRLDMSSRVNGTLHAKIPRLVQCLLMSRSQRKKSLLGFWMRCKSSRVETCGARLRREFVRGTTRLRVEKRPRLR